MYEYDKELDDKLRRIASIADIDYIGYEEEVFNRYERYDGDIDCNIEWNPYESSHDALELAVALQFGVLISKISISVTFYDDNSENHSVYVDFYKDSERLQATRDAICEAALEMERLKHANK